MTVSHILAVLSSSDLVIDVEIIEMNVEPKTQSLRAKATLKKGYVLYVNEGIGENYRRYSYHLQKDDEMIRRWDNAPHWRDFRTFPFHLHIPDNDKPIECGEVFVNDVLLGIRDIVTEEKQ
jgi:predicted RNase H-like nuclease (RuvC/YqgF family)